jgi:hypothetical protein
MISEATTSLSTLFREWLSPLRQQVEAKSSEKVLLLEKYGDLSERRLEENSADATSIPQVFPPQNIEQAPSPQSTRTRESKDDGALVTVTSPVLSGAKEQTRTTTQEQLSTQDLQTRSLESLDDLQQRNQLVTVPSGATILDLVSQIYGKKNMLALDIVREYNPHVSNLDRVLAGERLWMPALNRDTLFRQQADGSYHLIVASFRLRKEADRWVRAALGGRYPAAILLQEISMTTRLYRVVIEDLRDLAAIERAWQFLNSQGAIVGAAKLGKQGGDSSAIQLQASPLS